MIRRQAILLDEGGDGGGGNEFLQALPEDLRGEASLQSFKDVGALAKSHVEVQKMVGQKRLAAPSEDWGDTEWSDFYQAIGRPEAPDKYTLPEVKWEEGLDWDKPKLEGALKAMHGMGLTQKQAASMLELYAGTINEAHKSHNLGKETSKADTEKALRGEWGDDFDSNVELAQGAMRKFGDEEFTTFLEESGLDNHPGMVKFMHSVAGAMLEDTSRGQGGGVLKLSNQGNAKAEIDRLRLDNDFMKAFTTAHDPNHAGAVSRMEQLMKVAYPGKEPA